MKANAPEKLYISDYGSEVRYNWHPERLAVKDIEYIRTDAFIDKACEFLKSYRQNTPDGFGYIAGIVNDKTIDDFKDFMKGEEV